jgi:hypothetical protein
VKKISLSISLFIGNFQDDKIRSSFVMNGRKRPIWFNKYFNKYFLSIHQIIVQCVVLGFFVEKSVK